MFAGKTNDDYNLYMEEYMKRKIILYIATSLDGYIARQNGGIDWLFSDQEYGYTDFYKTVDTTLMGRKTYEQLLGFGKFPYIETQNFVFSKNRTGHDEYITYINEHISDFMEELRAHDGKDIWLVGGGELINYFHRKQLIDTYILSIHPVLIGRGIPLFYQSYKETRLELTGTKTYSTGLVQVTYERKSID